MRLNDGSAETLEITRPTKPSDRLRENPAGQMAAWWGKLSLQIIGCLPRTADKVW